MWAGAKISLMDQFLVYFLIVFFLVFVPILFINDYYKKRKWNREAPLRIAEEKEKRLKFEKELKSIIQFVELTPEIKEIYYINDTKYQPIVKEWRSITKNKTAYFESEEVFLTLSCQYKGKCEYKINDKYCVHWDITLKRQSLQDINSNSRIGTIYIGEGTVQAFEDEVEMKKIEERLRRQQRNKELEEIVKDRLKQESDIYNY